MEETLHRLELHTEARRTQFHKDFASFAHLHGLRDWEGWFSPYDGQTYEWVQDHIAEDDVVLEIGAGDLRLALRMADRARRVYAVEVNPLVVGPALADIGMDLPRNLHVICANALDMSPPPGVTVAVLLMRHCQHFGQYFDRLRAAGCRRLLTNARWKSGVEMVDLTASRVPYERVRGGWYACRCGAVGYTGDGQRTDAPPTEVIACPACSPPIADADEYIRWMNRNLGNK
jgi:hypothetical protein